MVRIVQLPDDYDEQTSVQIRQRKKEEKMTKQKTHETISSKFGDGNSRRDDGRIHKSLQGSYWLTRIVFLRSLAFIYFVAFLVALHQNRALLGKNGLLPANLFLKNVRRHFGGVSWETWNAVPTLLWLFNWKEDIDMLLDALAYFGLFFSALVLYFGSANMIIMTLLWALYHSIVNVGQTWYSFGWESQLLEVGFLSIFLVPLKSLSRVPKHTPTPWVVVWGNRWLLFRIMLGAGLIKIRGDKCWRELTCMNYHYETQPVPNPVSYFLHQSPEAVHKFETASNHFVELVAPFLLLLPFRRLQALGGLIQLIFQTVLVVSGNLSFLNWLTMLPAIFSFDDAMLAWLFPRNGVTFCQVLDLKRGEKVGPLKRPVGYYIRHLVSLSLALLLAYLSIPVVRNLLSERQAMNTSFDSLRLVNTYGAFGSITKERTEVVVQVTDSRSPEKAHWQEIEFKCKPGDIRRRPCVISPYHYRLDWLMWFAAFQNYQHNPWLIHFAAKLLAGDESVNNLIEYNPFAGKKPPRFLRMEHYRYEYTALEGGSHANWWKRRRIGTYLPVVRLEQLCSIVRDEGWKVRQCY